MTDKSLILSLVPRLRRYARLAAGDLATADNLVIEALELAIAHYPAMRAAIGPADRPHDRASRRTSHAPADQMNLTRHVYFHLNALLRRPLPEPEVRNLAPADVISIVDRRLQSLSLLSRQIFLLSSVERFADDDISAILELANGELQAARQLARREMARQLASNVLVLEDDLFTATDIEYKLTDAGHHVVGVAATQNEAVAAAAAQPIDIVLADIQLADGGNGIAAVQQICATRRVPAIYLTAYPERVKNCGRSVVGSCLAKPFLLDQIERLLVEKLFLPADSPRTPPIDTTKS